MKIRRCHTLFVELREQRELDFVGILEGAARLKRVPGLIALAPHLDNEVAVDLAEVAALHGLSPEVWVDFGEAVDQHGEKIIRRLLDRDLLIADSEPVRTADQKYREGFWRGLAAVAHRFLRWRGIDTLRSSPDSLPSGESAGPTTTLGEPPPATLERTRPDRRMGLQLPVTGTALDQLLDRRVTCRNFSPGLPVSKAALAELLHRTYGARSVTQVSGVTVVKKGVPSAGGLHPIEAYLLIRNVEGIDAGLYHYHPLDHALEPLTKLSDAETARLAGAFVAQQPWFIDAPVMIVLVARFKRNFWKYRNHAKAYRAVVLDAGHLSQTQYLAATEMGLAAFITAAINEGDIEDAFGLDPMEEGVLAVTGFGYRGDTMAELEFDPLNAVWPAR